MTTTEVAPTHQDLVDAARDLQDCLCEFADYGDSHRRAADEVIEAFTAAGMFRLFTPRRYGGYEADLTTLLEVTEILGEADGSAAWLVGVAAAASWVAAHAPVQLQNEIFGTGPDARLAGGGSGAGAARPVDGGAVVTGRWSYASGSCHAAWAAVAAALGTEGQPPSDMTFCVIPIAEVQVEDTWHTAGLRGTGSNTILVTDVFVPEHRIVRFSSLTEESATSDAPLYRVPMPAMGALAHVGPLLGIGNAALAHVIDAAAIKGIPQTIFATQRESVGVQLQVADAALKLQTARLHARSVATTMTHQATTGTPVDSRDHAQALAEAAHAGQQVLAAVSGLLTVHGSGGLADGNPLQRLFRDINTGARHVALNPSVRNEVFGKTLLGVADQTAPVL